MQDIALQVRQEVHDLAATASHAQSPNTPTAL